MTVERVEQGEADTCSNLSRNYEEALEASSSERKKWIDSTKEKVRRPSLRGLVSGSMGSLK
jgi:hypothetical protein